jgi:biopolymer transport protein ExbD
MTVRFPCPNCGKSLRADSSEAGRKGSCRACGSTFVVPATSPVTPPAAEPTAPPQQAATAPLLVQSRPIHQEDLVDMTAMVDVVFFLLIFFLVTSTQVLQSAIRLPSAEARQSSDGKMQTIADYESNEDYVVVRIEPDDRLLVDDVEVLSEQDLRVKLRETRTRDNPPSGILVVGHADATHGAAVQVFDAAADLGIQNVRLSVEDDS